MRGPGIVFDLLFDFRISRNKGVHKFAILDTLLRSYVAIPSSPALARRWAAVRHERRHMPIGVADAWIAATTLEYGLELVTHNAQAPQPDNRWLRRPVLNSEP